MLHKKILYINIRFAIGSALEFCCGCVDAAAAAAATFFGTFSARKEIQFEKLIAFNEKYNISFVAFLSGSTPIHSLGK